MLLSNAEIISHIESGQIYVEPFDRLLLRPASICLRLGSTYLYCEPEVAVDLRNKESYPVYRKVEASVENGVVLPPNTLVLANTIEKIALSRRFAARLGALSGLARLGLIVALSDFISPGYGETGSSTLTLELINLLDTPITVYPGMRICHLMFLELGSEANTSYDSQVGTYSHQSEPAGSRFYTDYESN